MNPAMNPIWIGGQSASGVWTVAEPYVFCITRMSYICLLLKDNHRLDMHSGQPPEITLAEI